MREFLGLFSGLKIIIMYKKVIIIISLLILVFSIWLIFPLLVISNSAGSEYYSLERSNVVITLRSRLINTFKNLEILEEIKAIELFIKNKSNNENSNKMTEFNPYLERESIEIRNKLIDSFQINSIEVIDEDLNFKYEDQDLIKSSGLNNHRHYEVSKTFENPELIKIIETKNIDNFNFSEKINVETTPIFYKNKIYFTTSSNSLVAYNFEDDNVEFSLKYDQPPARRGFLIDKSSSSPKLFFGVSSFLKSVNADDGKRNKKFGTNGYVKLGYSSIYPEIVDSLVLVAVTTPSSIVAVNKYNGNIIWRTSLIKDKNLNDGASPWAGMVVDRKRNHLYVSTGNPKPPLYGRDRQGNNEFSNSIVAIDINDGNVIWSFQETKHDLWDLDVASAPVIKNISLNNRNIDVIIVPTKKGNLLVLDCNTGKLVFGASFQKASVSELPGEKTAEYQLSISKPKPFLDIFSTDQIRTEIKDSILSYNNIVGGNHQPPSLKNLLVMYGLHGGATWPGLTIDETFNQAIFTYNRIPWKLRMFLQENNYNDSKYNNLKGHNIYKNKCLSCHGDNRNGKYFNEGEFEKEIIPSLVGIEYTDSKRVLMNNNLFNKKHSFTISKDSLNEIIDYFSSIDSQLIKNKKMDIHYMWSMFYDNNDLPINNPPWGEIISYNLDSFEVNWRIPNGGLVNENNKMTGLPSYGGIASLSNGVFVTTGTPDNFVRIYDSYNGDNLWSFEMENAGSAPPFVFRHDSDDYLVIVSSGGKFHTYNISDSKIYIFKL